ncbi:MAG TPA: hypothetical protein VK463_18415 [Desulfomonilaceae bacterium]|nr:hypothetical protein [Desulfomonilaceae bacterium]
MSILLSGRLVGFVLISCLSVFFLFPGHIQASFKVTEDAFSISNAPGYCFAMAAFSRWYYLMHPGEPPLRKVFDKRNQQKIAKELQTFYSKNLIGLQAEYCNRYHSNQNESFKRFAEGLLKGEPRIVLLMNKGPRGAVLHAVLAYEYAPERNYIKIYDPNYINQERCVDLERREYTSLDITYNAICFPEVLQQEPSLVNKMESLYAAHLEQHKKYASVAWRGTAASPADDSSKRERYSRGPTR